MSNIERRIFIKSTASGAFALLGGLAPDPFGPSTARAQRSSETEWPNRPVRFIVPLAPGGGLDFVARVVGEPVSRALGQQVVIENRTGAGGTIGIETAIKSPPDGYSVLADAPSQIISAAMALAVRKTIPPAPLTQTRIDRRALRIS